MVGPYAHLLILQVQADSQTFIPRLPRGLLETSCSQWIAGEGEK